MKAPRLSNNADEIREAVREGYTRVAERASPCCGASSRESEIGRKIGYSDEELATVPRGANLGVGCGNPTAIDSLRPGDVVVDLGSGAGMDAFLAARQVGPTGRVIGVDMTDAMLEKARENARKTGVTNVEFRKGRIENLPIEDESVDVIISNCVINLSPEKDEVYREAYRVLRPGGRLMVSDIVLERPLAPEIVRSVDAYVGCVGGASLRADYLATIRRAGFSKVEIQSEGRFADILSPDDPQVAQVVNDSGLTADQVREAAESVTSLHILAAK
jgi:SAM-dependent methyltransferase